jgi:hypothetical protein
VPYLVERSVTPLVVDVPIGQRRTRVGHEGGGTISEHPLTLPYAGLPAATLTLDTGARVFTRHVVLGRARGADRSHREPWFQSLAQADWIHGDSVTAASALVLPVTSLDTADLVLRVEEGDNAPLPLASARLMLPGYRLRFYRGAGESLRLAYGRPNLEAPRYDIQLLAADVLGQPATEIRALAEPSERASMTLSNLSPRVFWGVLGIAVVILLGIVVRLVRNAS